MAIYLGIDGCRPGWVLVRCNEVPAFLPPVEIHPDLQAAQPSIQEAQRALIDMPIGLSNNREGRRVCDKAARKLLGLRRSAIFFPPVRPALAATTYEEACRLNKRRCGKKISIQAWYIVPKIRELDQMLRNQPDLQQKLRESHPELCFWALNGKRPLLWPKRSRNGLALRMNLLQKVVPDAEQFLQNELQRLPRTAVSRDDVIDAMVLALHASLVERYGFVCLPPDPPRDGEGLPMEIVFADLPAAPASRLFDTV